MYNFWCLIVVINLLKQWIYSIADQNTFSLSHHSLLNSFFHVGYISPPLDLLCGCSRVFHHLLLMIIKSPAHSSVLSPVFVRCTAPSSPTLGLLLTGQLYNKKGWRGRLVHFSLPLLPTLLILPRPYPRVGNSGEEGELRKKKNWFYSTWTVRIQHWCYLGMADGKLTFSLV